MRKKPILLATLILSLGIVGIVWAAPTAIYQRSILPQVTSNYDLGTSTLYWNRNFVNYVSSTAISASALCVGATCSTSLATQVNSLSDLSDISTTTATTGDVLVLQSDGTYDNSGSPFSPFAWSPTTNYSVAVNSTSTPLWVQSNLFVSGTLHSTYASSTAISATNITATLFEGALTGNVTGDVSGNAGTCTAADSDSTWTLHNSYPAACGAGEYVTAIGDTLTCSVPPGTGAAFAWTPATHFGANSNSTSTPIWLTSNLFVSGTAYLANELVIPSASNPTVDKEGELAINSTTSSLRYYDGTAERALYDTIEKTITLATSTLDAFEGQTASSSIQLGFGTENTETWLQAKCATNNGTWEGEFGDGTNWMNYMKFTTTPTIYTLSTNNSFNNLEAIYLRTGKVSSTGSLSCTVKIRRNVD